MELLLIQAKIPWYLSYRDIVDIFEKMPKYVGAKIKEDILTVELLTSIIARIKEDKRKQYRVYANEIGKNDFSKITWVGLENIFFTFNSTISKIAGSYMELGIVSSIINPEKEVSDLEHVLRE
jgi:hypothetical protein